MIKSRYYNDRINNTAQSNTKKWWLQIKLLTGQLASNKQAWFHQFVNNGTSDTTDLASQINDFLVSTLTPQFQLNLLQTSFIPNELFVSERKMLCDSSKLATKKTIGPEGICNRQLKEFTVEFTPIIKDIYNQSLQEGFLHDSLKTSIIYYYSYTSSKDLSPSRYQVRLKTYTVQC